MKICYLFLTTISLMRKMLLFMKFQWNKKFSRPCPKWVPPKLQVRIVSLHFSTKKYWNTVKNEVLSNIWDFFKKNNLLKEQNHTFIALVPKKLGASLVHQFRPISLCNIIYKIISKILADRFKGLLHHFISSFQSTFVPSRNIQDNTIMVHELFNSINSKRGCGGLMAVKIDMEKAFDHIE
jgi:hypothetical protein